MINYFGGKSITNNSHESTGSDDKTAKKNSNTQNWFTFYPSHKTNYKRKHIIHELIVDTPLDGIMNCKITSKTGI